MENLPADRVEAAARLRERLFLDPRDIRAMSELAALLELADDLPAAIDLYQRSLRVDPYDTGILVRLGRLWTRLGERDRARSWFARALAIDADCAEAASGIAGLAEADGLSEVYIRTLFDQYAEGFDANLLGTLAYRAPAEVAAMLVRAGLPDGGAEILDLGCGTGLSGMALRRFASRLDGVDLSPFMVAKARLRGIYDDLAVGEALAYLNQGGRDWDVVAAVDMLNYIGDLTPLFEQARSRIRPSGWFVGTVEKHPHGGSVLTEKRRYRHGEDFLRQALAAARLAIVEISDAVLRQEGGQPVAGLIFAARPLS